MSEFMTLVIKPVGVVDFPRHITINGVSHAVHTVAMGHIPAAYDIAEQFIKDSANDLRERTDTTENVIDELYRCEETLHQMKTHKDHGYGE